MRTGCRSWTCLVWRRALRRELMMLIDISKVSDKEMVPDSSQLCPAAGRGVMAIN